MHEINRAKRKGEPMLVVLCGPSYAGKTTFAQQLSKNFTIISTDEIRKRLGCGFDGSRYETKVWDVFESMKCQALKEDRNVILDACHISRQARWHSLQGPNESHRKICVVFDLPFKIIRERYLNEKRISLEELVRMWRTFQKGKPKAIHDPARLMRLPGFVNHKQPAEMCYIIDADPERKFDLASLSSSLGKSDHGYKEIIQKRSRVASTARIAFSSHHINEVRRIANQTAAKWPRARKGQRNCKTFQYAAYLVKDLALDKDQAWPILQEWNRRNKPPLPEWELRRTLMNAVIYGKYPVSGRVYLVG